ncbi:hypothetical protein HanRHA438_Chr14g0671931 [Helianthus annuus]|nr:hypothetical protein HanRHA438_Chr14g0671931 [Helianthus annuus]
MTSTRSPTYRQNPKYKTITSHNTVHTRYIELSSADSGDVAAERTQERLHTNISFL